jgi:hypothetical protein
VYGEKVAKERSVDLVIGNQYSVICPRFRTSATRFRLSSASVSKYNTFSLTSPSPPETLSEKGRLRGTAAPIQSSSKTISFISFIRSFFSSVELRM